MIDRYLQNISYKLAIIIAENEMLKHVIGSVLIFLLFMLLRKIFTRYIFQWILKLAGKTQTYFDEKVLAAFEKPLAALFIVIGAYFALVFLPLKTASNLAVLAVFRTALVIIAAWGLYNLTEPHSAFSEEVKQRFNIDWIIVQFLSKIIRFLVVAIALMVIAEEWGYDVNGFIAGLGLGGLAFALAAKDALANIFGGIVIIMDKPFAIGDWVKTPSVEGTVEEITFRSTRVKAFDQSVITVPNATLSNESIINFSRMGKRRISFYLGVTYDTPVVKLQQCVEKIRHMLLNHPDVHPETVLVYFEKFNDSSLDIFLYFFTNTTVWEEYLAARQDINFKIMKIMEQEGVLAAFPSQSIYFENQLKTQAEN